MSKQKIFWIILMIGVFIIFFNKPISSFSTSTHKDQYASFNSCTFNPWQYTASMNMGRISHVAVSNESHIYVLGGGGAQLLDSVEQASIDLNGSLGAWQMASPMITARRNLGAVITNNYIYALGGWGTNGVLTSTEQVEINQDGSLGVWATSNSMTDPRGDTTAVIANGYIYVIGGWNGNSGLNSIEKAHINSDGTLGSWEFVSPLTMARFRSTAVVHNEYIYVIGGVTDNGTTNSVERAFINSDGSLGEWQIISSMSTRRDSPVAIATSDYIYVFGGYNSINGATYLDSVERLQIYSDNTIGDWQTTYAMNSERGFLATTISNNYVYAIGGDNLIDNSVRKSVEWADISMLGIPPENRISINEGSLFTNQITVTLSINAQPEIVQMQVSNDGGFSGSLWESCITNKTWAITQYGNHIIPRVVYIRFKDKNNNISATYQDDIILDMVAPSGSVQIIPNTTYQISNIKIGPSIATDSPTHFIYLPLVQGNPSSNAILQLNAYDDNSGVEAMMISNFSDFNGASWEPYTTSKIWYFPPEVNTVYVKFRDSAGNPSNTIMGHITD